jgi:hypothetical protein
MIRRFFSTFALLAAFAFATSPRVRRLVLPAFVFSMSAFGMSAFVAVPAFAHNGGAGGPVLEVPRPPDGDGAKAFDLLKDIDAKTTDAKAKKVVGSSVERAKEALERAHGARASGDISHAHMLEGLALEWAQNAQDLLRAAAAEQVAESAADKAREAAVRAERARALLEETQARRGRAEAELEKALTVEREARAQAAQAEEARLAAGKAGPTKAGKDKPAAGKAPAPKKSAATPTKTTKTTKTTNKGK